MKTFVEKTEFINLGNGKTMELHTGEHGHVMSARVGKDNLKITKVKKSGITFNGQPVKYLSPGAVIITKVNPTCYYKRLPDGTLIQICYP